MNTDAGTMVSGLCEEFVKVHSGALSLSDPVKRLVMVSGIPRRTVTASDDAFSVAVHFGEKLWPQRITSSDESGREASLQDCRPSGGPI